MRRSGYFAPESQIRRIGGESVLMLGGGRALLMQAAHPLVAAAIVEHSRYRDEPWRRLARTMTALYTIVFGTRAEADRAGAVVRAVHERVGGRLAKRVGRFARGTPFAATDPALMMWVHSSLVDTGLVMYETYVGRLEPEEREGFYRDMRLVARVFGTPECVIPTTLADFRDFQRERFDSGELCVGDAGRAVAATVLHPPAPAALQPWVRALGLTSIGLLPAPIRERYGFRWRRGQGALLQVSAASSRGVLVPLLPRQLRELKSRGRDGIPLQLLAAFAR